MKFVTDLSELEGKVVAKAVSVDIGESIVLIFTDDTCAYFDVSFYGDSHEIVLADDADDYLKRDAGIISVREYEQRRAEIQEKFAEHEKHREIAELDRLKKKYEG